MNNSILSYSLSAAPRVRPGWIPYRLIEGQSIFWPSEPPVNGLFDVQVVRELVIACRVEGRPKAEVEWQFNGEDIQSVDVLDNSSVSIREVREGRSVLTINVEANQDILRGENTIECFAENAGGSTSGRLVLQGICE